MRKILFLCTFLLAICFLMLPANSMALSLSDVGSIDYLIDQTDLGNSGDATELAWVNGALAPPPITYTFIGSKTDTPDGAGWIPLDDAPGVFAYDVSMYNPDHFLVKTGNLKISPNDDTFLFMNKSDLGWAVIDMGEMTGIEGYRNFGKLSHIDTFGNNPVPEPATMLLFGSGLIGLAALKRKYR